MQRSVVHRVFVTEGIGTRERDGDGGVGATAICTWIDGDPPSVKKDDPVCVPGEYVGPLMRRCAVVATCP